MIRILFFSMTIVLFSTCTGNQHETETDDLATDEPGAAYTLTPFSQSKQYPDAAIQTMTYKLGKFDFEIAGSEYQLGLQTPDAAAKGCANSAQGQHIHLIVDNKPYAAKYEPSFDYEIADGEHYILAFLSRSYHESIKTTKASTAIVADIKDNSIEASRPITGPMLFYSRPKGAYEGEDAERVMLDYYLVNADSKDYSVRADINGEEHVLTDWQPYYIEGLPAGENSITLTLLDSNNEVVDAPLNPVTRTFTLNPEPTEN